MPIAVCDLLAQLIAISEKSAQISRLCRTKSNGLFDLLIQEKTSDSKNPRFLQDFKTFADVLIQEVAKYSLELKFPGLATRVYGEESNHFENRLGESITVQLGPDQTRTTEMLIKILDGDGAMASALVQIIYDRTCLDQVDSVATDLELSLDDIAIWIDPIDSTSEYINGQWYECAADGAISPHGLQCVTCLFGVFDTNTGLPLLGVINQPFHQQTARSFSGRLIWGFEINGVCQNNLTQLSSGESPSPPVPKPILVGGKESDEMTDKLNQMSSTLYVAGAGYKLLCVVLAEADLLVTSSRTTFYWDTCACHAILRSLGGGIVALEDILQLDQSQLADLDPLQVRYRPKRDSEHQGVDGYNHPKGLVAYRSRRLIERTIGALKS